MYDEIVSCNRHQYILSFPKQQKFTSFVVLHSEDILFLRGHRGRDCMVVGFTTTYAISAHHH